MASLRVQSAFIGSKSSRISEVVSGRKLGVEYWLFKKYQVCAGETGLSLKRS